MAEGKTYLLFLQFDKTVCRLLCVKSSKITDVWKVTLLSCFRQLRNLLVLKFGLYLEDTSQLICFFSNLCNRGYFVQKTLIQISSFCTATTLRVWDSGRDTIKFPPGRQKTKQSKSNADRKRAWNSERTKVKWTFKELLSDGSQN